MNDLSYPKLIEGLKEIKIAQVFAGLNGSFAVTEEGDLYVWGDVIKNLKKKLHGSC